MSQPRGVEPVAVAGAREFGHHAVTDKVGEEFSRGKRGELAGDDLDVLRFRDDDLLGHMSDALVHHEHDRYAIDFREVESLDSEVERFLR